MGDPVTIGLTAASVVSQVASASAVAQGAAKNAQAQFKAGMANRANLLEESALQRRDVDASASEAISDRVRRANMEIAQAQLLAGERGVSGSTRAAIIRRLAAAEGIDQGRIIRSRDNEQEAITSRIEAGQTQITNANVAAANNARQTATNARYQALGSTLRIGTSTYTRERQLDAAKNRG